MSTDRGAIVQGLLLEIDAVLSRFPTRASVERAPDAAVEALDHLFQLVDGADVALGDVTGTTPADVAAIPAWLVDGDGGGVSGLLDRLADPHDFGDELIRAEVTDRAQRPDWITVFQRLHAAVAPALERTPEPTIVAGAGTLARRRSDILVPIVKDGRGASLRLRRSTRLSGQPFLGHDDLPDPLAPLVRPAWSASFERGVVDGQRAAGLLLADLAEAEHRASADGRTGADGRYLVSGILGQPELSQGSAALPVALNIVGGHFRRLGPPPLAATGVIGVDDKDACWLEPMSEDMAVAKLGAVRLTERAVTDADGTPAFLLAPIEAPVRGVRPVRPGCQHLARPHLRDAAAAMWGRAWRDLEEAHVTAALGRAGLERMPRRVNALLVANEPLDLPCETASRLAQHFAYAAATPTGAAYRTWGVIGGSSGSGRTWIALATADQLEAQGWHVLRVRRNEVFGELPDVRQLLAAARIALPACPTHSLIVLDDVRDIDDSVLGGEDISHFADSVNDAGFHLLLVVDGRRRRSLTGATEWNTDRAPATESGLGRMQQDAIVQAALDRVGMQNPLIQVEGTSLTSRLRWVARHSAGRARLDRPPVHLPARTRHHARTAFAAGAALARLGVRPRPAYLRMRSLSPGEVRAVRGLAEFECDEVLDGLTGSESQTMLSARALADYLTWTLQQQMLEDVARVLNRLLVQGRADIVELLVGHSTDEIPSGQLEWSSVMRALSTGNHAAVARLVAPLRSCLGRYALSRVVHQLAQAVIAAEDGPPETPDDLARSLWTLYENRKVLRVFGEETADALIVNVQRSLTRERLWRALESSRGIGNRWYLVRALARIIDDPARFSRLLAEIKDDLFATERPWSSQELGAALRLHKEIEGVREAPGRREHLRVDRRWVAPILDQSESDLRHIAARMALAGLKWLYGELPDVGRIARDLVEAPDAWNIHQLLEGLGHLEQASPQLAGEFVRTAMRAGLNTVLSGRLTSIAPISAGECISLLIKLDPQGTYELHYERTAQGGTVPRPDAVAAVVAQLRAMPDIKGIGKLFHALATEIRDIEMPDVPFVQEVVDALGAEFVLAGMDTPRATVASHFVASILANDVVVGPELSERWLNTVLTELRRTRGRLDSAAKTMALLEAEEREQLTLGPRNALEEVSALFRDRIDLVDLLREADSAELLGLVDRLSTYIDVRRSNAFRDWSATRYAATYAKASHGCSFCRLQRGGEAESLLSAARTIQSTLRRGGHPHPDAVVRTEMEEHWFQHGRRDTTIRVYTAGAAAQVLALARRLRSPRLAACIEDDALTDHLLTARPTELATIVASLHALDPARVAALKQRLADDGALGGILDAVSGTDYGLRVRLVAYRQLERADWQLDARRRDAIHDAAISALSSSRSVPNIAEAVRAVARRQLDKAVQLARLRGPRGFDDLLPLRHAYTSYRVTLAGRLQGVMAVDAARAVLDTGLVSAAETLAPVYAAQLFDRVMDLRPDALKEVAATLTRRARSAAASLVPDGDLHLVGVGDLAARHVQWTGEPLRVSAPPWVLLGTNSASEALWALAWIECPGWDRLWARALDRLGEHDAGLMSATQCAHVLGALLRRNGLDRIPPELFDAVVRGAASANARAMRILAWQLKLGAPAAVRTALDTHARAWDAALNDPWWTSDPDRRAAIAAVRAARRMS